MKPKRIENQSVRLPILYTLFIECHIHCHSYCRRRYEAASTQCHPYDAGVTDFISNRLKLVTVEVGFFRHWWTGTLGIPSDLLTFLACGRFPADHFGVWSRCDISMSWRSAEDAILSISGYRILTSGYELRNARGFHCPKEHFNFWVRIGTTVKRKVRNDQKWSEMSWNALIWVEVLEMH